MTWSLSLLSLFYNCYCHLVRYFSVIVKYDYCPLCPSCCNCACIFISLSFSALLFYVQYSRIYTKIYTKFSQSLFFVVWHGEFCDKFSLNQWEQVCYAGTRPCFGGVQCCVPSGAIISAYIKRCALGATGVRRVRIRVDSCQVSKY